MHMASRWIETGRGLLSGLRGRSSPLELKPGLYHYTHQDGSERSRIHLRVDPGGHGTLIVNANRVMHLNPTAAFMAWLSLEKKPPEECVQALSRRYAVSRLQAGND